MNKEFKYGDEVIITIVQKGDGYIYLSPHPEEYDRHFLYSINTGSTITLYTDSFRLRPKTHIVNGVEVPAPIRT